MGEVYRADDLKLGQPVALKFLPRDLAHRSELRSSASTTRCASRARSRTPTSAASTTSARSTAQHFLSMEYVDGEDLASLLRRIGRLPAGQGARDRAPALRRARRGARSAASLHRDLKPANVMIDGRGQARITDFGLAARPPGDNDGAEVSGTPAYMAPEQLAGKGASTRSDIYALGLVL